EPSDDILLECPLKHNIENADVGVLGCKPLDAPNALLNNHRIPRQIIVYEDIRDLKIHALRASFCRYNDPTSWWILSKSNDRFLVARSRISVDDSHFEAATLQEHLNRGLCLPSSCEHDQAPAIRILLFKLIDQFSETHELSALRHPAYDRFDARGEVCWHGA